MFSLQNIYKKLDNKSAQSFKTCRSILRTCPQNGKQSSLSSAKYQMLKKIKHKGIIGKQLQIQIEKRALHKVITKSTQS